MHITFDDLAKAMQRESWGPAGLGQVTCPDGSSAPDALSCLPVESPGGGGLLPVVSAIASQAEQPYYVNLFGMQVPTPVLFVGGAAVLLWAFSLIAGGGRR